MKNAVHLVIFMRNMPCRWSWKNCKCNIIDSWNNFMVLY